MLTEVTKKSIRTSDLQEEVWSQNLPNTKNEFTMTMLSPLRRTAKKDGGMFCNLKIHSQKPNNRNRMYRSSSPLSHRCSKKNKWLPYSNCKSRNTIRTQLPWEGTFPVDVNKSRRHIKRSNTRTIDVREVSSRKRTFSCVACIEEWQTTVITNKIHSVLRGIISHKKREKELPAPRK